METAMQYSRALRVQDLLKKEISQIILEMLKDPQIGFVTITAVEVSADLKNAKVFYSVLGTPQEKQNTASALNRARGFVQAEINRRVRMKKTPQIDFEFDHSLEYGDRIDKIIEQLHQEKKDKSEEEA